MFTKEFWKVVWVVPSSINNSWILNIVNLNINLHHRDKDQRYRAWKLPSINKRLNRSKIDEANIQITFRNGNYAKWSQPFKFHLWFQKRCIKLVWLWSHSYLQTWVFEKLLWHYPRIGQLRSRSYLGCLHQNRLCHRRGE